MFYGAAPVCAIVPLQCRSTLYLYILRQQLFHFYIVWFINEVLLT